MVKLVYKQMKGLVNMLTITPENKTNKERTIERTNLQKKYLDSLIEECDNIIKYGHKTTSVIVLNNYEKSLFIDLGVAFKTFMNMNGNKKPLKLLIDEDLELPYATIFRIVSNEKILSVKIVTVENFMERLKEVTNTRYEVILSGLENVE
ncbi:MAG: hypothetical protein L0I93_07730 [Atopostipes suicloacalis]|nr:hypothetical protein [Atopostipes suicloacalis]